MKIQNALFFSVVVLSQSLISAYAGTDNASGVGASAPAADVVLAPTVSPTASLGKVPKLNIRWDCGDCTKNEKVIPLLEQTYSDEAVKNSQAISTDDVADAVIVDYRQRPPAMRAMFGLLAGKDRIGLKVKYKGKELAAEDSSANAVQGMNALCESVAKIAFKKIVESTKQQ